MQRLYPSVPAVALLLMVACGDAAGPGNANENDRAEILTILQESGWFDETFGEEGATVDASLAVVGFDLRLASAAMDTVPLIQRWGRRYHAPTNRSREVNVSGDTATVDWSVRFADGEFMLDRTNDGVPNPTSKPMDVSALMTATLVRRAEPDSAGRRWRLVALSPRRLVPTDESRRTVSLTAVTVAVNGVVVKTITDASRRDPAEGVLALEIGDEVRVMAEVQSTTGLANIPETFVFLHLYHARADTRGWMRVPMRRVDATTWAQIWIARHEGRQQLSVDALDSQTFNSDTDDDYRGEAWGVPYRIR
ncbi:MAG: hypothetical protein WD934_06200 [Gemmatimonadales bacterium]